MKLAVVFVVMSAIALSGCATGPKLPPGSYADLGADYSKDSGVTGRVNVHVPLSAKRKAAAARK